MQNPRRRRRNYPYYKIQVFDDLTKVWKDERKVFDTAEEAQNYIRTELTDKSARIMVVERNNSYVLDA